MKRVNPVASMGKRKVLSGDVVNPVGDKSNTGPGLGKGGNLPKKPKTALTEAMSSGKKK